MQQKIYHLICKQCGRPFDNCRPKAYCTQECQRKHQLALTAARQAKRDADIKRKQEAPQHFIDTVEQAKRNGTTYGKYVANRDINLTKVEIPTEKRKSLKSANMRRREQEEKKRMNEYEQALIVIREYCLELEMQSQDNPSALSFLAEASYHLKLMDKSIELAKKE